jgi:hypothetical protein
MNSEGTKQQIVKVREQINLYERKEEGDLVEITNEFMVEITSLKKHKGNYSFIILEMFITPWTSGFPTNEKRCPKRNRKLAKKLAANYSLLKGEYKKTIL